MTNTPAKTPVDALIAAERLPQNYRTLVEQYWAPLANHIARKAAGTTPLIVGISGAQGSGKSTLCRFLELHFPLHHSALEFFASICLLSH